ncbi:hypothetical protein GVAV_000758 [Gurleya vavrai]
MNLNNFQKYTTIKITTPISLLKHLHQLHSLKYKPSRIDCLFNPNSTDFSLLKERQHNYQPKLRAYSHKLKNFHLMYINHIKKIIYIYEIKNLYRFNSFTEKNIQLNQKSNNKEELEHRKKNVNFILKKIEFEDTVNMEFCKGDLDISNVNEVEKLDVSLKNNASDRIRNCIYRARIVNLKTLLEIFNDKECILKILMEMCIKVNGRFVLKNKFYDKEVRRTREKVLNKLKLNETIFLEDKSEKFIIEELCNKKENYYFMKGIFENIDMKENVIEINEIFREYGNVHIKILVRELELAEDDFNDFLSKRDDIMKLYNDTFVLKQGEHDEFRKIIVDYFTKNKTAKKNELVKLIKEKSGKEINVFMFGKIMKEFCVLKGNNYVLKDGKSKNG